MKTTAIYHSADFDGLFCREIARKFLPDAELIGWDFGDEPLQAPDGGIYVMDLPLDAPFGGKSGQFSMGIIMAQQENRLVWIDHHKSAIESHAPETAGYRIDGVAACRLAWQYFTLEPKWRDNVLGVDVPSKQEFIDRKVKEPLAVRLAGEYDIWDKRDPDAELFQHGLRSQSLDNIWEHLLSFTEISSTVVRSLLDQGRAIQYARAQENESVIKHNGFDVKFEGLNFLACNHARFNSQLFTAGIKPEHDALLGFRWDGKQWNVSLYHAPGKEHHDLSLIATKLGGGGHKGACGFRAGKLPFLP